MEVPLAAMMRAGGPTVDAVRVVAVGVRQGVGDGRPLGDIAAQHLACQCQAGISERRAPVATSPALLKPSGQRPRPYPVGNFGRGTAPRVGAG